MNEPLQPILLVDYRAKYRQLWRKHVLYMGVLLMCGLVNFLYDRRLERTIESQRIDLAKDHAMLIYAQSLVTNLTAADKQLELDCKQLAALPSIQKPNLTCHNEGDLLVCDDLPPQTFTINPPQSGCTLDRSLCQ
jgi:hypothetical protein